MWYNIFCATSPQESCSVQAPWLKRNITLLHAQINPQNFRYLIDFSTMIFLPPAQNYYSIAHKDLKCFSTTMFLLAAQTFAANQHKIRASFCTKCFVCSSTEFASIFAQNFKLKQHRITFPLRTTIFNVSAQWFFFFQHKVPAQKCFFVQHNNISSFRTKFQHCAEFCARVSVMQVYSSFSLFVSLFQLYFGWKRDLAYPQYWWAK